jgi:tetratricopeptide (TPR) repeat protein
MLKQILPLFFLVFFIPGANAQLQSKAKALYKEGLQFKEKQMMPDALNAFTSSIKLYNKFDSAHVEAGLVNLALGKKDEAVTNFHSAIALTPKMTIALMSLGKVYRDFKPNLDSALLYYTRAAKTDSINKEIFYSIAWTYNAKLLYDSAIIFGKRALALDNDYRQAYSELAHAYRRVNKFAEAIEQFKKNLAISTVDLALLYSGYCYTELKDKVNALVMYEALKKVNEKMSTALKRVIDKMQ